MVCVEGSGEGEMVGVQGAMRSVSWCVLEATARWCV